ncbi:MAG: bifunctional acetaldehyde-CoA/alcohol dehydrogenase, partial [Halanaerobiales bacterium]
TELARIAVEETGRGIYEDKIDKNLFAAENIYNNIKDLKTAGIIEDNPEEGYVKIAEPAGVIAGLIPVTNPTSTTIFKALVALKARNPIIFSFHPGALECCIETAMILRNAAVEAGAPEGCITWISEPSVEKTRDLMSHVGVDLILATGGENMVKAAYSSGTPALGVGPGNVPCYVEKTADLRQAAADIILSKTFDHGMICASEQSVIVDREIADQFRRILEKNNCYFLNPEEQEQVGEYSSEKEKGGLNPEIVGQSAAVIAERAGIEVPQNTKILIGQPGGVGEEYPLSREKLSPVLAWYTVDSVEEGINLSHEVLEYAGLGHTAVIHSRNDEVIDDFSTRLPAGRMLVNSPSSHGAIGDLYNNLIPSLTLGCGTMGGNSTTDNVSTLNLVNIKKVTRRKDRTRWFRIPPEIYFEKGSLRHLQRVEGDSAVIITDATMKELGFIDKVKYHLDRAGISYSIFSDVEPDPSVDTVERGCRELERLEPDMIIALGGGSPIDAAKGMWLFYEDPEAEFNKLKLKFADIRKRTNKFPQMGERARFIAIPTTSGTGSEVTAFSVITDKKNNVKYPLADYQLTPDMAIIDPELVMTVPPKVTADTGMDVLTHALEARVSVMASDYTDALADKAIRMVFEYLPRAYHNPSDEEAREKMHNASCLAGMAFTNAFLGLNHSMAHILGGRFHIPHGRANAILLPHVIRYNASVPTKQAAYPQYEYPRAAERYTEIARHTGLPAFTVEEGVENLVQRIEELKMELGMPGSIADTGVSRKEFEKELDDIADVAFNDQTTGTNPRKPLVGEIKEIYRRAYEG